ncbi:hypothetical protein WMY93_022750 [Mugilogobius chulae]|uniref:Uncharacterized protein n=1 Tax=Mugilogobius chulae TaxID=88201 RepID=A0AAW0NAX4_9GOBI
MTKPPISNNHPPPRALSADAIYHSLASNYHVTPCCHYGDWRRRHGNLAECFGAAPRSVSSPPSSRLDCGLFGRLKNPEKRQTGTTSPSTRVTPIAVPFLGGASRCCVCC